MTWSVFTIFGRSLLTAARGHFMAKHMLLLLLAAVVAKATGGCEKIQVLPHPMHSMGRASTTAKECL